MSEPSHRRYWIFSTGSITNEIRYLRNSLKRDTWLSRKGRARIKERLRELELSRYLDISCIVLQEEVPGLLGRPEESLPLHVYSQDGELFEFFSGVKLGDIRCDNTDAPYVEGPYSDFFWLARPTYADSNSGVATEVDAATFASSIKRYLPKREQIVNEFRIQLQLIVKHNEKKRTDESAAQTAKDKKNADAENFLNKFI